MPVVSNSASAYTRVNVLAWMWVGTVLQVWFWWLTWAQWMDGWRRDAQDRAAAAMLEGLPVGEEAL